MIGCLRTRVRKQPIIALHFESETVHSLPLNLNLLVHLMMMVMHMSQTQIISIINFLISLIVKMNELH